MFLLRRTASKVVSTPTVSLFTKPRTFSAIPAAIRVQKQWITPSYQRRLYSDEISREQQSAAPTDETIIDASSSANIQETSKAAPTESAPAGAEGINPACLYVGNLFFEVTEEQLRKVFSPFGEIQEIRLVVDNRGLSRGFGFVYFVNKADADAALASLNQQVFEGRRMIIGHQTNKPRNARANEPVAPHAPSKTLFIGNMSFEMSDPDLNALFADIRNVMDVRVAIDRRTGQPRGFAHAEFIDIESAEKAKEILKGKVLYGRPLRVDFTGPSSSRRPARSDAE